MFGQAENYDVHERSKPADAAELAAIAERGRAIAAYDAAAWHATDEVKALHPRDGLVRMYVGRHTSAGWVIDFGRLNEAKDAFLIAFETTPTSDIKKPVVKVDEPVVEDRGEWLHEARALELTRERMKVSRPYNAAVIPAPNGEWYVYFYPAQTTNDSFPTGADVRYLVSADGSQLLEKHQMRATLLEFKLPPAGTKADMTFRTAFLDDAPEDTDTAYALMMGGVAGFVMGHKFTYHIEEDGSLNYLMTTQAFMKVMKKK